MNKLGSNIQKYLKAKTRFSNDSFNHNFTLIYNKKWIFNSNQILLFILAKIVYKQVFLQICI